MQSNNERAVEFLDGRPATYEGNNQALADLLGITPGAASKLIEDAERDRRIQKVGVVRNARDLKDDNSAQPPFIWKKV
jgi:hypothetical protein